MAGDIIDGVLISHLKVIDVPGGNVLHAMKRSDQGFDGFGEGYFSIVEKNVIKAWKKHLRMTVNLVVPFGEVKFVMLDDQNVDVRTNIIQSVTASKDNYIRLTIPPNIWFGFKGLNDPMSIILNLANTEHDPEEVLTKQIDEIEYNW